MKDANQIEAPRRPILPDDDTQALRDIPGSMKELARSIRELPENVVHQVHAIEAAAVVSLVLGLILGLLLGRLREKA